MNTGGSDSFKGRWAQVDQTADPQQYVRYMDSVIGEDADDLRLYRGVLALLDLQEGDRILDVGCGVGGAALALAQFVGAQGQVVGVDNSAAMIGAARHHAAGFHLPLAYLVADAHRLPFAAGSFDRCFCTGVFEIVADPAQALREMIRVTRSNGQVVVPAPDFGTAAIDATDRALTRRICDFIADQETNGWIGRQLYGLGKALGLSDVQVVPSTWITTDFAAYHRYWLGGYLADAQAAGVLTAAEAAAWLADLQTRTTAGRFFFALTGFTLSGRKP